LDGQGEAGHLVVVVSPGVQQVGADVQSAAELFAGAGILSELVAQIVRMRSCGRRAGFLIAWTEDASGA
jgi:hypothetical protein